jgi:poly(hydroxyalkanoate) granule-associated protein
MVKKLQKMANKKSAPAAGFNPAALLDNQVAQNVRDSAQQIWAAGLGAFNKAQGEGSKVFETLVKEGMSLQKKTQSLAEQKFGAVASKMSGMAGDVGSKAGQQWDKLESIFEERVSRALKSLGVPSGADVGSLISRIDALSAAIGFAPAKKAAPAKSAAKAAKTTATKAKTAVKKVAAKVEKAAAPVKKAAVKKVAAVKKAVTPVKATPARAAVKSAQKAVAEVKVAAQRAKVSAPRKAKAAVEKAVEVAKDAVQA